jgi:hypothetical protein
MQALDTQDGKNSFGFKAKLCILEKGPNSGDKLQSRPVSLGHSVAVEREI